jgi:hypothetical protein
MAHPKCCVCDRPADRIDEEYGEAFCRRCWDSYPPEEQGPYRLIDPDEGL